MLIHVKRKSNSALITNCLFSMTGAKNPKDSCKQGNCCLKRCVVFSLDPPFVQVEEINIDSNNKKCESTQKSLPHTYINAITRLLFSDSLCWKSQRSFSVQKEDMLFTTQNCRALVSLSFSVKSTFGDCSQNSSSHIRNMQMWNTVSLSWA